MIYNIFEIPLLFYLFYSIFAIILGQRRKKIVQQEKDIITLKSKCRKIAARVSYLSKLTKLERATKELEAEQKLIERLTNMRNGRRSEK
jgi:cbb3-type cytochrome oxidase subunit 3